MKREPVFLGEVTGSLQMFFFYKVLAIVCTLFGEREASVYLHIERVK